MDSTDIATVGRNLPEQKEPAKPRNLLVQAFGFRAALAHGDTLMADRWFWLTKHLPRVEKGTKRLLDVGCGTGAFTIGAATRGYRSLGLSWDRRNQTVAADRAVLAKASLAEFEVLDVRDLDSAKDLVNAFDVVICFENIEHIINDRKLMVDIRNTLQKGGTLLLTTPYLHYRRMTASDDAPLSTIEDGGHIRKGYTREMLLSLCEHANLTPKEIGYCSGFLSQKVTAVLRTLTRLHPVLGWAVTFPLRLLPLCGDGWLTRRLAWPSFSITLVATKP